MTLKTRCDPMKTNRSKKNSMISWGILGIGALLALIGAMMTQNYDIHLLTIIGGLIVVAGIVSHLVTVRCPYCGHSLAGYRPLPGECPKCHKPLE